MLSDTEKARQDCIERKGDCGDCSHALESMGWRCMIRWTDEVIQALGQPTEPKPKTIPDEEPKEEGVFIGTCKTCGERTESTARPRIICDECDRIRRNQRGIERRKEQAEAKARELEALVATFDGIDSRELCARYGVSRLQVRTWQQLVNPIPYRIIGRKAYYSIAEVDAWMAKQGRKESA